jgi:RNA polymerase sigma-70 factor, ECF subfamily
LMLLHDSRRDARMSANGELILLEEQDRSLWNRAQIHEGLTLLQEVLHIGDVSEYALQAAIAGLHARAQRAADTDWRQIAQFYDLLLHIHPSPVVELNRAVAVAMADGAEHGLRLIDELEARGELDNYHLLPAARADLLRRLGRGTEAERAYRHALSLVTNVAERRFLEQRLTEMTAKAH